MSPLSQRFGRIPVLLVAAGLLTVVFLQRPPPQRLASVPAAQPAPPGTGAAAKPKIARGEVPWNGGGSKVDGPKRVVPFPVAKKGGLPTTFGQFNQWSRQYLEASPENRPGLVERGVQLAQARRKEFKRLISENPGRALENAVPMVLRQQLPAPVVAQLGERVSARGFCGVLGIALRLGASGPAIQRQARMADLHPFQIFC